MTLPHEASLLDTTGRLLIAGSFLVAGLCNLRRDRVRDHIERMAAAGMPAPAAAFWFGLALQFSGCVLLLAGWHTRIGTLLLLVFTVAATSIFHRFWGMADPGKRNISRIMFINNTTALGGLLLLLANQP